MSRQRACQSNPQTPPPASVGEMARWLRTQASVDSWTTQYNNDWGVRSLQSTPSPHRGDSGVGWSLPGGRWAVENRSEVETNNPKPHFRHNRPDLGSPGKVDSLGYYRGFFFDTPPDLSSLGVHKEALGHAGDQGWWDNLITRMYKLDPKQHATIAEAKDVHGNRHSVMVVYENAEQDEKEATDSADECDRYESFTAVPPSDSSFVSVRNPPNSKGTFIKILHMAKNLVPKVTFNRRQGSKSSLQDPQAPKRCRCPEHTQQTQITSNTGLPMGVIHPDVLGRPGSRKEWVQSEELRRATYERQRNKPVEVVGSLGNGTTLTLFIDAASEPTSKPPERPLPPLPVEAFNFDVGKQIRRKPVRVRNTSGAQKGTPVSTTSPDHPVPRDEDADISDILRVRFPIISEDSSAEDSWESISSHNSSDSLAELTNWTEDDSATPEQYYNPRYSESKNDEINRIHDLARLRRLTDSDEEMIVDTFLHGSHVSSCVTERVDQGTLRSRYGRMVTNEGPADAV